MRRVCNTFYYRIVSIKPIREYERETVIRGEKQLFVCSSNCFKHDRSFLLLLFLLLHKLLHPIAQKRLW